MKTSDVNTVWEFDEETGKMIPSERYNNHEEMCYECGVDLTHNSRHYLICSQSEI